MCRQSHQAFHLLFKYYNSKLGGGIKACADNADAEGKGPRSGKTC